MLQSVLQSVILARPVVCFSGRSFQVNTCMVTKHLSLGQAFGFVGCCHLSTYCKYTRCGSCLEKSKSRFRLSLSFLEWFVAFSSSVLFQEKDPSMSKPSHPHHFSNLLSIDYVYVLPDSDFMHNLFNMPFCSSYKCCWILNSMRQEQLQFYTFQCV